jgi:hypothetical protein
MKKMYKQKSGAQIIPFDIGDTFYYNTESIMLLKKLFNKLKWSSDNDLLNISYQIIQIIKNDFIEENDFGCDDLVPMVIEIIEIIFSLEKNSDDFLLDIENKLYPIYTKNKELKLDRVYYNQIYDTIFNTTTFHPNDYQYKERFYSLFTILFSISYIIREQNEDERDERDTIDERDERDTIDERDEDGHGDERDAIDEDGHGDEPEDGHGDECYQYTHHARCKKNLCIYDKTKPIGKKCYSK